MAWRGCSGLVSALARYSQHSNGSLPTIYCCFLPNSTKRTLKFALVSSSALEGWRQTEDIIDNNNGQELLAGAYLLPGSSTTTATNMTTNLFTKCSCLFPRGIQKLKNTTTANFQEVGYRYYSSGSSHYEKWTNLSYDDLEALIEIGDLQLFDVREPKEILDTGKIPCAVNIPLGQIKDALDMEEEIFSELYQVNKPQPQDTNIVFVGFSHIKSSTALELAHRAGFKKARHYHGGYEEWLKKQQQLQEQQQEQPPAPTPSETEAPPPSN